MTASLPKTYDPSCAWTVLWGTPSDDTFAVLWGASAELSAVFFAAAAGKAAVSSRQTMSSSGKMRYFFISFSMEL